MTGETIVKYIHVLQHIIHCIHVGIGNIIQSWYLLVHVCTCTLSSQIAQSLQHNKVDLAQLKRFVCVSHS